MKVTLGRILEVTTERIQRLVADIERAFEKIPENVRRSYDVTLNFAAPGAVPGITTQSVTIEGVELGDTIIVAASIATPAGFMPPRAEVSAANTVIVSWAQLTGVAADPDGAGATYTIDCWRH